MEFIILTILKFFEGTGYWGVFFLMTVESSFIPFPSELVIPPMAYLASLGEYNVYLVIFYGVLGTLFGALINYFLALKLGRIIVYKLLETRLAKALFLSKEKVQYAEDYFLRYGNISTFIGRLVPAVRQLISIPAGFSKMNLKNFIIYTSLGSSIWIIILAILGYQLGENKDLLHYYYSEIKTVFWVLGVFLLAYILYKIYKINKK